MRRPEVVLIAAVGEKNRVIGRAGTLPWHIPEDLKHFKRLTTGHPLVMGRRTFESILRDFGGPLPRRKNVVITRRGLEHSYPGVETFPSVEEALKALQEEPVIFIGGGQKIYEQTLPLADRLELTVVEGDYEGDTFFPPYEHLIGPVFEVVHETQRPGYRFITLRRRASVA